jgi:spore maturation protein CgeB
MIENSGKTWHSVTFNTNEKTKNKTKESFSSLLKEDNPDLVIIYDNRPGPLFDVLKENKGQHRVAYWHGDWTPLRKRWCALGIEAHYTKECPIDYLFVVSAGHIKQYRRDLNTRVVSFLPHEFAYDYKNPIVDPYFGSEVAFLGQCGNYSDDTYYKMRKEFVAYLIEHGCPLRIFPDTSDLIVKPKQEALGIYSRRAGTHKNQYLDKTYGSGKIFLGIDTDRLHKTFGYLSSRPFSTMGFGSFYLAWQTNGIERLFIPGKHLETFSSFEEGWDKIKYYLKNEKERSKIAQTGRNQVFAKHLIKHRLRDMLLTIKFEKPIFSSWI